MTSVTSPIDYRQFSGRADWTLSNATRLMVRYTQDSWKNDGPSIQANLWGDDPFPVGRFELGPAEQVVRGVAEPDARATVRPTRCSSRTRRTRSRSRAADWIRASATRSPAVCSPIFAYDAEAVRHADEPPGVLGRRRLRGRSGTKRRSTTTRICSSSRTTTRGCSASTS